MQYGNNFNHSNCGSVAGIERDRDRERDRNDIRVEDSCIVVIDGRFFLVVLFEFRRFERVAVFRISRDQAVALEESGVRVCRIFDILPTNLCGRDVELQCVFVVDGFAFIVLEVENNNDRLVIVRAPLCAIERRD